MESLQEVRQKLRRSYQLKNELVRLEQQRQELSERLAVCRYTKREAEAALLEYEHGGVKRLLDKLTGKWEEKREELSRDVRNASGALEGVQRAAAETERMIVSARQELAALEGLEVEYAPLFEAEPGLRELRDRLEALHCAIQLAPLLEENDKALKTAGRLAKGDVIGELSMEEHDQNLWFSRADTLAQECRGLLERIAQCGILLEIHPYFANPAGYIMSATRSGRLDRLNHALDAIWEAKHQIKELCYQLAEE